VVQNPLCMAGPPCTLPILIYHPPVPPRHSFLGQIIGFLGHIYTSKIQAQERFLAYMISICEQRITKPWYMDFIIA